MGRLNEQIEPQIQHFSHPHPLQVTNITHTQPKQQCNGCRKEAMGWMYSCKSCSFLLHRSCSQMPSQITHPFHQNNLHVLHLLPIPIYPERLFNCDACRRPGDGFSYHCTPCGVDLHVVCASMPLSLAHPSHPHHPLSLAFSPPYFNKVFSCDICSSPGFNHWLYRCDFCGFDAHLECANNAAVAARGPVQRAPVHFDQGRGYAGAMVGAGGQFPGGATRPTGGQRQGSVLNQVFQGLAGDGGSQNLVQGLLCLSGLGGLGGGGNGSGCNASGCNASGEGGFAIIDDSFGGANYQDP